MISPLIYNNWLIAPQPVLQPRLRLFCFPYAGGTSQIFRTWPNHVPDGVEIVVIELPGRGRRFREKSFERVSPLVRALAEAIAPHLTIPFAFFGHSLGALVSFELARLLRETSNVLPKVLYVSARKAPQLPKSRSIYHLPDSEFIAEIQKFNGTPTAIFESEEFKQIYLPSLRSDFSIIDRYEYVEKAPLPCPIVTFGGHSDRETNQEDLEAWQAQTSSHHELRMMSGGHFFINTSTVPLLASISSDLGLS
ncbi:MAG: alpha/beta fold hydrolase [Cyanobacteria bacterium J06639_1]